MLEGYPCLIGLHYKGIAMAIPVLFFAYVLSWGPTFGQTGGGGTSLARLGQVGAPAEMARVREEPSELPVCVKYHRAVACWSLLRQRLQCIRPEPPSRESQPWHESGKAGCEEWLKVICASITFIDRGGFCSSMCVCAHQ